MTTTTVKRIYPMEPYESIHLQITLEAREGESDGDLLDRALATIDEAFHRNYGDRYGFEPAVTLQARLGNVEVGDARSIG